MPTEVLFMPNSGFIDIHCHILPGLDEGPNCRAEAVQMLRIAREDGTAGIAATPHILDGVFNNTKDAIAQSIKELNGLNYGIQVYMGAEVRISRNLRERISRDELPLLNNKTFLLLELPSYLLPPLPELEKIITDLRISHITPIVAHPERNVPILHDLSIMERLIHCGAAFQVTAMSITGHSGRRIQKAALEMIQEGYVHAVASDAHDATKRPPLLSHAYAVIEKKFGADEAQRLFCGNPLKIVSGSDIADS